MILAAGRGERLRPLTDKVPKALVEVGGASLIERQLERLARARVGTVVINLGWMGETIVERIGDGSRFDLQVVYSPEYDEVLETGGGIRRALPLLGRDPFWVLNSDVFTDIPLAPAELAPGRSGHLVLVPVPPHRPHGDFDLVEGEVRRSEQPAFTFSGMAIYRPELFESEEVRRFPLAPLLFAAAERGALSGELYQGEWEDVGTIERLERLNAQLNLQKPEGAL
jgi:N-acetyl-alpha-D-muramate 1-phosphate uridylyltransferase